MDLIRAVALLIAAGSALAAAASLGGAFIDDLDILTHLAPAWLGMAVLALVLAELTGFGASRAAAILACLTIGVCAFLMAPELIARASAQRFSPAGQTVKIVQFNVWDHNRDTTATVRWILEQNADIVVLEETGRGAVPAALAGASPYRTQCDTGAEGCATTILSKLQPADGGQIRSPGLGPRHVGAWARFGDGAAAFTVVGAHFRWPDPLARQADQRRRFADRLASFDKKSLIVVGDFNLTPWSFALKRQDARLGLTRLTHAIFTFPAGHIARWRASFPFPLLPIDQVYAGSAWRPVSVSRGEAQGSDHFPIVAILTRGQPASK